MTSAGQVADQPVIAPPSGEHSDAKHLARVVLAVLDGGAA